MITKKEYNYVVGLFFKESPYRYCQNENELFKSFLKDFILKHQFLLTVNKIYSNKYFSKLIRNYNNGKTYEKNGEDIKIKNCTNWQQNISLKADLIFYGYICKRYKFKIKRTHLYIELINLTNN